jgi:hypothetical protein
VTTFHIVFLVLFLLALAFSGAPPLKVLLVAAGILGVIKVMGFGNDSGLQQSYSSVSSRNPGVSNRGFSSISDLPPLPHASG